MHTKSHEITICSLKDWSTLSEFLTSFNISKNQQKKYLSKKQLLQKIFQGKEIFLPIDLFNTNMVSPVYVGPLITVIQETDFFIAISKPVKTHSLPLTYSDQNNLLAFVRGRENSSEIFNINKESYEKGLLFRLDFETSGLILMAKTDQFFHAFREKIEKRKFYLAVVQGEVQDDFSYAHHVYYTGEKGAIGRTKNGSPKNSHLEGKKVVYNEQKNLSLVMIKLDEGLRHQIRIQLSAEGTPILGDPIYGRECDGRMYLHSFCYQFEYEKRKFSITDENINDLESILNVHGILKMAHQALLSF